MNSTDFRSNQENLTSRTMAKATTLNNKVQPLRRAALDDLGNKIHNLQHAPTTKSNVMGPPVALPRKKVEVKKKADLSSLNKENVSKKGNSNQLNNKEVGKKPIRQESIILAKNIPQVENNKVEAVKKQITEQTKELTIYDPDEDSRDDPQMVTEYVEDILKYLRNIEKEFPIKEKFLENTKVTPKMRTTLVNWLVDAHRNFSLGLDSLHLAISVTDRYLQAKKSVDRNIFQLVGTAALLLACKIDEVYFPDIDDFVYICDNAFTKRQLLQMEVDIIRKLDFRMGWPISIYFLRRYSKIAQVKGDQYTLSKYILELALLEYSLAHVKPSIQAASACCLAIAIINEVIDPARVWTPTLVYYTSYKYIDLKPIIYEFARMIANAETSKFDAIRLKYSTSKFGKISVNFKLQGPLVRKLSVSPVVNRK